MKAEVTAENKPACTPNQYEPIKTRWKTDEDQGRAQVFVMFLEKFLVILVGNLAVVLVEPSPMSLLSRNCILFRATRGPQRDCCRVRTKVTCVLAVDYSVP